MSNETERRETPKQQDDSKTTKTAEETAIDRIADEAATRGVKRQQGFDSEHNIFTE